MKVAAVSPTVTVTGLEVAAALSASPPYSAVIAWLPTVSAAVVKVAVVPLIVRVPSGVEPSLKVTVPLGDEPPDSVAVKSHGRARPGLAEEAASADRRRGLADRDGHRAGGRRRVVGQSPP